MHRRSLVPLRTASRLAALPVVKASHPSYVIIICSSRMYGNGKVRLRLSFNALGLDSASSEEQVRSAYVELAKVYHPDSKDERASPEKFAKLKEAYTECMLYLRNVKETEQLLSSLEEEMEDLVRTAGILKHRAVAHRKYLSHDVGPGTYSERERRHQQLRLDQAVDSVFEQQLRKSLIENNKDKAAVAPLTSMRPAQERRITQTLERLADDLIREAMAKGEFEHLPGQGKPLSTSMPNVALDDMSSRINQILINSGFTPEWIMLEQEMRDDLRKIKLKIAHSWFGLGQQPMTRDKWTEWETLKTDYIMPDLKSLNMKVDHFNLIVPILSRQFPRFELERLIKRAVFEHLQEGLRTQHEMELQQKISKDSETAKSKWIEIWEALKSRLTKI